MLLGYARVSTDEQDTRLQRDALTRTGCERIYEEASGSKENRPELTKLLDHARKGDVVIVWKLDRLAHSLTQLITTAMLLAERGWSCARSPNKSTPRHPAASSPSTCSPRLPNSNGI